MQLTTHSDETIRTIKVTFDDEIKFYDEVTREVVRASFANITVEDGEVDVIVWAWPLTKAGKPHQGKSRRISYAPDLEALIATRVKEGLI
jgi:hypothetical protein